MKIIKKKKKNHISNTLYKIRGMESLNDYDTFKPPQKIITK